MNGNQPRNLQKIDLSTIFECPRESSVGGASSNKHHPNQVPWQEQSSSFQPAKEDNSQIHLVVTSQSPKKIYKPVGYQFTPERQREYEEWQRKKMEYDLKYRNHEPKRADSGQNISDNSSQSQIRSSESFKKLDPNYQAQDSLKSQQFDDISDNEGVSDEEDKGYPDEEDNIMARFFQKESPNNKNESADNARIQDIEQRQNQNNNLRTDNRERQPSIDPIYDGNSQKGISNKSHSNSNESILSYVRDSQESSYNDGSMEQICNIPILNPNLQGMLIKKKILSLSQRKRQQIKLEISNMQYGMDNRHSLQQSVSLKIQDLNEQTPQPKFKEYLDQNKRNKSNGTAQIQYNTIQYNTIQYNTIQ